MHVANAQLWVHDQDEAVDFYVNKLGWEIRGDVTMAELGNFRWLTVGVPGEAVPEIALTIPGPPVMDEATAQKVRDLVTKGVMGGLVMKTDDCFGLFEKLKYKGVEFTQEPTERFYGTDCALRDPFGNPIRFTQPPNGPIVVPSAEELRAQA